MGEKIYEQEREGQREREREGGGKVCNTYKRIILTVRLSACLGVLHVVLLYSAHAQQQYTALKQGSFYICFLLSLFFPVPSLAVDINLQREKLLLLGEHKLHDVLHAQRNVGQATLVDPCM